MRTKVANLYDKWERRVVLTCFVLATIGIVMGTVGVITNARQDTANAAKFSSILRCFDTYAAASAGTSSAVRAASVKVSEAETDRDQAMQAVFLWITTDHPDHDPQGAALFETLLDANSELVEAQAQLAQVRADNPVPPPPSTFCDEQP